MLSWRCFCLPSFRVIWQTPSWGRDKSGPYVVVYLFGLAIACALMLREVALAQADILWRHFDQFIVIDEVEGLFQAHDNRRRQTHRNIGGRGADVCLLLLLANIHHHVHWPYIEADNHALVDRRARLNKRVTALLR